MPSISNDTSANIDYVDYFVNQLPKNLAQMASLRDELAARQGALSAVEEANKSRAEAEKYARTLKEDTDNLLADAKSKGADATARLAVAKAKEATLVNETAKSEEAFAAREKEVALGRHRPSQGKTRLRCVSLSWMRLKWSTTRHRRHLTLGLRRTRIKLRR